MTRAERTAAWIGGVGWTVFLTCAGYIIRKVGRPIPPRPREPSCCPQEHL